MGGDGGTWWDRVSIFSLKVMSFVFKMMSFVFKMMIFGRHAAAVAQELRAELPLSSFAARW